MSFVRVLFQRRSPPKRTIVDVFGDVVERYEQKSRSKLKGEVALDVGAVLVVRGFRWDRGVRVGALDVRRRASRRALGDKGEASGVDGLVPWVVITRVKCEAAGVDGLTSWVVVARDEAGGGDSLVSGVGRAGAAGEVEADVEVEVDEEEEILREARGGDRVSGSGKMA